MDLEIVQLLDFLGQDGLVREINSGAPQISRCDSRFVVFHCCLLDVKLLFARGQISVRKVSHLMIMYKFIFGISVWFGAKKH